MITVLSPQGAIRGAYVNNVPDATPYFEDKLLDNLETEQTTLEFAVPLQSPDSEWLEGFSTVLYPDKDGVLRELTVINVWEDWNREEPVKRVVCEDSSVDILLKTHVVPFTAGSLEEAIRGALMSSPWEYVIGEDTANIGYYLVDVKEYTDVRSTLETIKQTYGIEYRFSARFDGRKLTRVLNVAKQFGADTGKYFIYDRDLVNIEREISYDNIHTSVITYWQEDDVIRTLAGYNPVNKIAGFRKDIASDQIYHNQAHSEYDSDDYGKVLIMKSSSTDPELSYLEACNKLLDYIAPTYTYNVNVHILENALGFEGTEQIHLGDTVWLKEKVGDMELGLSARVIQLTTSHTNPEEDEVIFTNFKEIDVADSAEVNALRDMIQQIQEQQDTISQTVVQVTENITQLQQGQEGIIVSLDGKSSISVGDTPNPNPKNGDTWFTDVLDPETGKTYSTTKVWVEATQQWETKYSAKDAEEALAAANEAAQAGAEAKEAADAAKQAADDATAAGNAASEKADQAVTDAAAAKAQADAIQIDVTGLFEDVTDLTSGVASASSIANAAKSAADAATEAADAAKTAADEAQTAATNAQTNASKALTDAKTAFDKATANAGKISEVETSIDGVKTTVATVKTTADSALSKATTVETTVNGVKTTVAEVQADLDATTERVTATETSIEGVKTSVSSVQTTANSALSKATTTETTVNGLKTTITNVEKTADSAVTKANTAQATADGNTTKITAVTSTANSALTKATSVETTVNGLSSKITSVETTANSAVTKANTAQSTADGNTTKITAVTTTANSALTKATSVETTVNGLKTTVGEVKTTADSALSKASQVEQTAEGLKTTITAVQTDMKQLSNRNLLSNTATLSDMTLGTTSGVVDLDNSFNGNATAKGVHAGSYTDTFTQLTINTPRDGKFTITFWAKADRTITFNNYFFSSGTTTNAVNSDGKTSTRSDGMNDLVATTSWKKYWITYTNVNATSTKRIILGRTIAASTLWINSPMLVEGAVPADWQPAPEDMATNAQVTQIEATVDGLTTTVGQVKTTADSALSKATSVEQTANGLKTTVATIQTDIVDLTNRFPDYNFQKQNPKPVAEGVATFSYVADGLLVTNNGTGSARIYWGSPPLALEVGKSYNIKMFLNVGSSSINKPFEIGFSEGENLKFSLPDSTNRWVQGTIKSTKWTGFSLIVPPSSTIKVHEMYIYEANTNITSSQITQLSDNINLKVDKNGVIAQINVSSEGVLIDGKNVWITGLTKIDNAVIKTAAIADLAVTTAKIANLAVGTAQIGAAAITEAKIGNLAVTTAKIADLAVTDAKIGSLSANKITTGTLDAGVISVINLNASNIKSGTLSGLRIESPYDVPVASGATANRRGSLVMVDGYFRNVWQTYVRSSGSVTANGELTLNHESLTSVERIGASTTVVDRSMQLTAYGLTLQNSAGQGGTLSFQDLFSLGATSIPARSGFEQYSTSPSSGNHPTAVRNGRVVQLKGSFRNINPIDSGSEGLVMGLLPVGFRPLYSINFIVQGTGANIYLLTIEPTGELKLGRYRGDTGSSNNYKFDYKEVSAGSWLNIACVFAAADV